MAGEARKDFFISYNKADKAWAEWIAWELEAAGYSIIIQAWDFLSGSNFILEMDKACTTADQTIAVLSPDYLKALYTKPEWGAAFAQDPTGEKKILRTVRVRECDLTGLLKQIVYIDLVGLNETAAKHKLLADIKGQRVKPDSPPVFPIAIGSTSETRPRFPGSLPPIWNVPHPRNPNFTGREQLLKDLRASLTAGQTTALTQAALHGLGGIGKTQLALEYAYRYATDYDIVWWVRSETPAALAADYAALAGPLDLPEKGAAEQETAVAAARQHLGQRGKWLLVFDNAAEPEDLKNFLPLGGGGHVLITSRHLGWRGLAQPLKVKEWPREEAVAFLLKRTGQEDEATAGELAKELGDLPLALEQAAAYMEACGQPLSGYLQLFRQRNQELLRQGRSSQDYPDTVATTWELSFQKVKKESPAAADLLNLCAFLAPDDIPREMLAQGAEHLPQRLAQAVNDPLALNAALAALRRYSLLEVGEGSLTVHRLVQAVARDRLDKKGKKKWAGAAVEVVNEAYPGNIQTNVEVWPWCARLLPHALAAGEQTKSLQVALPAAGRLMNQAGFYLKIRAEFVEARKTIERALAIGEAVYGPEHPEVATAVNNLGSVLLAQIDLAAAKSCYERALTIWEKVHGPNHPDVATAVNNLGDVLRDLGDLAGAKLHYERALTIFGKAYGSNHPQVAVAVNNLGSVLQALGDLAGAKSHYERALAIDEAVYGPNHPNVANDLGSLGYLLRALGDLAGAKSHYERALTISEKVLGLNHPKSAAAVNNLGSVLQSLGDLLGAKSHYERALAIDEAAYGPNHPSVARDVNNLGSVLLALGDLEEAKGCGERALRILRQFLGDDHPKTKMVEKNLASLGLSGNKR